MTSPSIQEALGRCNPYPDDSLSGSSALVRLARDSALYLLERIDEESKKGGHPAPRVLAQKIEDFIHSRDPSISPQKLKEVFDGIRSTLLCLTSTDSQHATRTLNTYSLLHLVDELERHVEPVPAYPHGLSEPSPLDDARSVENGSRFNRIGVNFWEEFRRFRLDSGVIAAGFDTAAAAPYARVLRPLASYAKGPVQTEAHGALGGYVIFPPDSERFGDRIVAGVIPSLQWFTGLGWDISAFGLRAATQVSPRLWTGVNQPPDIEFPLEGGASLQWRPSEDNTFSLGATTRFDVYPQDIQDPSSIRPNDVGYAPFIAATTEAIDAEFHYWRAGTGDELEGEVGRSFAVGSAGFLVASVEGFMTVRGTPVYPPGVFLNVAYVHNVNRRRGFSVGASIRTASPNEGSPARSGTRNAFRQNLEEGAPALGRNESYYDNVVFDCDSGELLEVETPDGGHFCRAYDPIAKKDVSLECYTNDQGEEVCARSYGSAGDSGPAVVTERVTLAPPGEGGETRIVSHSLEISDPLLGAISQQSSFADFARALRNPKITNKDRLAYLHYLTARLYESFDDRGMVVFQGNGGVNDISVEEMYEAVRGNLLNPLATTSTTVCRGIARFSASLAHAWGWEGYVATIGNSKVLHVVALVKSPDAEDYEIIDKGNYDYEGTRTLIGTLENYTAAKANPPQLRYVLYDHEGNYVRSVPTSLGTQLFDRTTVPDRLTPYLRGR